MGRYIKLKKRHLKLFAIFLIIFLIILAYKTNNGKKEADDEKIVREPAVAGSWYPGDASELAGAVDLYLNNSKKFFIGGKIKALMLPHAGYGYSGIIAAYGLKQLEHQYKTVI